MEQQGFVVGTRVKYGLAALAGSVVVYGGASWWAGHGAEQAMAAQVQQLGKMPYFVVKSSSYKRGWLSAEQTVELELTDRLTWPYQAYLKFADKPYTPIRIKYRNHVQHGPLPLLGRFNLRPLKAYVETELILSADAKKALKPFFGEQPPIRIENRIAFNNDGQMRIRMPAFDYQEALSGVKLNWQGMDSGLTYSGDYTRYGVNSLLPGTLLDAASKGQIEVGKITLKTESQRGVAGLMLGRGEATLGKLTAGIKEPAPFKAGLTGLRYSYQSSAEGDFLNSDVQLDLATLDLNGKHYGPAHMAFAARHLHAPTVARLEQLFLDMDKQGLSAQGATDKAFELVKKNGLPLLRHDPQLELKQLNITLPEGKVNVSGKLALKGFQETDLEQPLVMLEKIDARADIKLPKKVVETYVRLLVRNILIDRSGSELNEEQVANIDNLAQQLVQGQIANLLEQKLIRAEGDILATSAVWHGGKLAVNEVNVPLPWQVKATVENPPETDTKKP